MADWEGTDRRIEAINSWRPHIGEAVVTLFLKAGRTACSYLLVFRTTSDKTAESNELSVSRPLYAEVNVMMAHAAISDFMQ